MAAGAALAGPHLAGAQNPAPANPARDGAFEAPFVEPTIGPGEGYPRVTTNQQCIERPKQPRTDATQPGLTHGFIDCKPTASGINVFNDGKVLYWDNLAGTENQEVSIAAEFGITGLNDQTRLLDSNTKKWMADPTPIDGGAKNAEFSKPFVPGAASNDTSNDGDLFCSDENFTADGNVIANGGTKYRNDPGTQANKFAGSTELEGIPNTRIYERATNTWKQSGDMNKGRWYPTSVTLGNGNMFTASGLRKLIKPVNTNVIPDPSNPTAANPDVDPLQDVNRTEKGYAPGYGVQEGQNERTTETFLPNVTSEKTKARYQQQFGSDFVAKHFTKGAWVDNGESARKTLPLFPRLHLLPDGHVFYNAGGQSFAPNGQAYDEALWNLASTYNPENHTWKDLGIPGLGTTSLPGFRGSTFSVMMPLVPDAKGRYAQSQFLTAGGVPNPPSPGGYFAVRDSDIRTVDSTAGQDKLVSTKPTGLMAPSQLTASGTTAPDPAAMIDPQAKSASAKPAPASTQSKQASVVQQPTPTPQPPSAGAGTPLPKGPLGRWYPTGTLLPDGEVLATNGADRDEVVTPGDEIPQRQAQLFDPKSRTWRGVAFARRARTYHNTAALLPDGRVLVSGHAIISNDYLANRDVVPGFTAPNREARDPNFEIYSPPYMFQGGKQGTVTGAVQSRSRSDVMKIATSLPASQIKDVRLVRSTALTHIVDGDQRTVVLRTGRLQCNTLNVSEPPNGNVAPPGPYMLFANTEVNGHLKPLKSFPVTVGRDGHVMLPNSSRATSAAASSCNKAAPRRQSTPRRRPTRSPRFTG